MARYPIAQIQVETQSLFVGLCLQCSVATHCLLTTFNAPAQVVQRVTRKFVVGNVLWGKVRNGLQQGLLPEQVAGTRARMNEPIRLCHETIYQAIYMMPKGELHTDTIALLRFGHGKHQPRARL